MKTKIYRYKPPCRRLVPEPVEGRCLSLSKAYLVNSTLRLTPTSDVVVG